METNVSEMTSALYADEQTETEEGVQPGETTQEQEKEQEAGQQTKEQGQAEEVQQEAEGEEQEEQPAAVEPQSDEQKLVEEAIEDIDKSSPVVAGLIKDLQGERAKRQDFERQLAELKEQVKAQVQPAGEKESRPTTIAELKQKYDLGEDDAPTCAMLEEMERNREEKTKADSHNEIERNYQKAEAQLAAEIGEQAELAGLGIAQILKKENTLCLTGHDFMEIAQKPPVERPAAMYHKIIEKTPLLKSKYDAFQSSRNKKQQQTRKEGGEPPKQKQTAPKKEVEQKEKTTPKFTQEDILEDKVSIADAMYPDAEEEG